MSDLEKFREFFARSKVRYTEDENFVDDERYQATRPAPDRDASVFLEGSRFYFDKDGKFMGVGSDDTGAFEPREVA